ncbi:hypothetical protein K4A83_18925 [Spirulina subsalsa FACHB-351]|uniref:Probable transposase IS891/IS1136/IS1341 domain-containing protein n=1 Tax=Spirulina subsalsa FACHB-351 TaxID=234711 RepID=A0ABT3L9Z6_9CYAN|nr:transposase [Spirulina subsalsa]MCW6038331.1 hypothetical protein [Spirulina subsalsa FACHB-351]
MVQRVSLLKKADGWYVSITLKDESVPELLPINEIQTAVGVDMGLKEFAVTSTGETFPIQQFYRRAQAQLAKAQRQLSRKQWTGMRMRQSTFSIGRYARWGSSCLPVEASTLVGR